MRRGFYFGAFKVELGKKIKNFVEKKSKTLQLQHLRKEDLDFH